MGSIILLPTELLVIIFLYVYEKSRGDSTTTPNRTSFPFNAASVCKIWLNILKSQPQYWAHVQIDLADHPTPFIDTICLFKKNGGQEPLSITVFSSVQGSRTLRSAVGREGHRAKKVFQHMQPYLSLYENITFDVVYQSSLPSAAGLLTQDLPILKRLSLMCKIHNLDDKTIRLNSSQVSVPYFNTDSGLVSLSLTGRSFMELCHLPKDWRDGFKTRLASCAELHVTHLTFIFTDDPSGGSESYEFSQFGEILSNRNTPFLNLHIHLSDFSINYNPDFEASFEFELIVQALHFTSVSSDFLRVFFSCFWPHTVGGNSIMGFPTRKTALIIRRCEIPDIRDRLLCFPTSLQLVDVDIPPHTANNCLCNAFRAINFEAREVVFSGCVGVTDDLLVDCLCAMIENNTMIKNNTMPFNRMESLMISNCGGFTVGGIQSFIRKRVEIPKGANVCSLQKIKVTGSCPPLSVDEAAWFLDKDRAPACDVEWDVEGEYGEGFVTKLNTASA